MNNKIQHAHASFISEALMDVKREIETYGWHPDHDILDWYKISLSSVLADVYGTYQFRFADKVKSKIVSSLTDNELINISDVAFNEAQTNRKTAFDVYKYECREIANAAAQRAIEDLKVPTINWILKNCPESEWDDRITYIDGIQEYLKSVKEGTL